MIKLMRRLKLLWGLARWMENFEPIMIAYQDNNRIEWHAGKFPEEPKPVPLYPEETT